MTTLRYTRPFSLTAWVQMAQAAAEIGALAVRVDAELPVLVDRICLIDAAPVREERLAA